MAALAAAEKPYERALLKLTLAETGGVRVKTRVREVDNARERIYDAGRIVDILGSETLAVRIDGGQPQGGAAKRRLRLRSRTRTRVEASGEGAAAVERRDRPSLIGSRVQTNLGHARVGETGKGAAVPNDGGESGEAIATYEVMLIGTEERPRLAFGRPPRRPSNGRSSPGRRSKRPHDRPMRVAS